MKTIRRNWIAFAGAFSYGLVIVALTLTALAQPVPVLTIAPTGTNQFQILITNGVSYVNYELYRTPVLSDPNYPWTLHIIGSMGQSNFTADTGIYPIGFFKAAIGSDWDGDGILNFQDGDPSNPAIGVLSLTISSPTNGATFN